MTHLVRIEFYLEDEEIPSRNKSELTALKHVKSLIEGGNDFKGIDYDVRVRRIPEL